MSCKWAVRCAILVFFPPLFAQGQTKPSVPSAGAGCPIEMLRFNPSGISVRVRNVSGKKIVGLVFNAALADATEHWQWVHWGFDRNRPLEDFNWNRPVEPGAKKNLTWSWGDLNLDHGSGGAFVLTSILFEDGSGWESPEDSSPCKYVWYNRHKKQLVRSPQLPTRERTTWAPESTLH